MNSDLCFHFQPVKFLTRDCPHLPSAAALTIFFEGVIELRKQLNMASGRRLIKIHEELKTVTTTQTACFRLSAIKMDFG